MFVLFHKKINQVSFVDFEMIVSPILVDPNDKKVTIQKMLQSN
jgi:hypothetical protein